MVYKFHLNAIQLPFAWHTSFVQVLHNFYLNGIHILFAWPTGFSGTQPSFMSMLYTFDPQVGHFRIE